MIKKIKIGLKNGANFMNQKYLKVLEKFKNKSAGVFVDESNLFYIQRKIGWKIDWPKLKKFLEKYFKLTVCRYYMGMPLKGRARLENEEFIKK